MFSGIWQCLQVCPRTALIACFPVLSTSCRFAHAEQWLHVFPYLALVACSIFPHWYLTLISGLLTHSSMHVFPRLGQVTGLPTNSNSCNFFFWHELKCFLRFPMLGTGCLFSSKVGSICVFSLRLLTGSLSCLRLSCLTIWFRYMTVIVQNYWLGISP